METTPQPAHAASSQNPSVRAPSHWAGEWWPSLLVLAAIILFFAPVYARHARLSADPAWFNDDARQQIWPMMKFYDPRLFHDDYMADYYLACFPVGYRTLYSTLATFWSPIAVSKVLPYWLLGITVLAAGRAARRLRGPAAGWAAVALCLGASIYLQRMAGGLPRSFAFPFLALIALALARGRPVMLGVVTLIAASIYPAVAVVGGLLLTVWLGFLPAKWRGNAETWGTVRRVIVLAIFGGLTVAAAIPSYLASGEYGPLLHPSDREEYKELGDGGRYRDEDRADRAFAPQALKNFIEAPLAGLGGSDPSHEGMRFSIRQILLMALAAAGIIGFCLLARTSMPARRMLLLPAVAVVAYVLSVPLAPMLYLPARYQLYPLAIAALVIVPAGIAHLSTVLIRHVNQRRTQSIALGLTVGSYLVCFSAWQFASGAVAPSSLASAGLVPAGSDHPAMYDYLRKLRPTVLVAGWPTSMDNVPYLTGRSALVTRENHQAFHRQYAEAMRLRVHAVIDAMYDPELTSLQRLRDEFGVTHFLVDRDLYGPKPPTYFAPFDMYLADTQKRYAAGGKPAALRELDRASVSVDGVWVLMDLNRLPVSGKASASAASN